MRKDQGGTSLGKLARESTRPRYRNAGLESSPDERLGIWFKVKSYPSFFSEVPKDRPNSDTVADGSMFDGALKKVLGDRVAPTTKNRLMALARPSGPKILEGGRLACGGWVRS